MIARSVTIVAPIVNEWSAPYPILAILFFAIVGIFTSLTFPKEDEFSNGQKIKEIKYDLASRSNDNKSDLSYHDLNHSEEFDFNDKL